MKKTSPHQSSQRRRERPAKPALTRQGIIEVALKILRDEGLHKVTMRRIADALDTGPSSLYVYVHDTEDLHAQILDALLVNAATLPLPEGMWRDRLKRLLKQYRQVLFDYPEIARMTLTTHLSGPNYLALVERILALLHEGEIPDHKAAWLVDLLLLYATATAVEHSTRAVSPQTSAEDSALTAAILTADANAFPNIARIGAALLGGGSARFDWSLDIMLNGVLNTRSLAPEQNETSVHDSKEMETDHDANA
jgi:AcrR family transcriptional regulator